MTFSRRLAATRASRGMSMSTLAQMCGVTTSAVSNWEAGNSTPREESMNRIARSLGVTRDFLERGGDEAAPAMDINTILERAKQDLARASAVPESRIRLEFKIET